MARAALDAGVSVAAGDTKVVERSAADGPYVTIPAIGLIAGSSSCRGRRLTLPQARWPEVD
jgi:hydrogenase maturation factor